MPLWPDHPAPSLPGLSEGAAQVGEGPTSSQHPTPHRPWHLTFSRFGASEGRVCKKDQGHLQIEKLTHRGGDPPGQGQDVLGSRWVPSWTHRKKGPER